MIAAIENHLWQSTLFAGVIALLTLALRRNSAAVRHGLWLAASVKFLVPFSLLISIGTQVEWRKAPEVVQTQVSFVMEEVGEPFALAAPASPSASAPKAPSWVPDAFLALWLCGVVANILAWWQRWRRVRTTLGAASPLALRLPIRVMSSPAGLEPGVFGICKPILLLPEGITDHLTPAQFEAIVTHELCHVRRRDNLAAAIHMVVEALIWFHPLVWWIRARLVEERERACDEEVLRMAVDPQDYAEGILTVCKFYLKSPLICVSGVTGGGLKRRVETIMMNRDSYKLNVGRKLLLAGVGMLAVGGPLAVGVLNSPPVVAQEPAHAQKNPVAAPQIAAPSAVAAGAKFAAASIKASAEGRGPLDAMELGFVTVQARASRNGRFSVSGARLDLLIELAYGVRESQILGLPRWAHTDGYDVNAKAEGNAKFGQMRPMLQSLLADRFRLTLHRESRESHVYELSAARGGLKIAPAPLGSCVTKDPNGPELPLGTKICGGVRIGMRSPTQGFMEGFGVEMRELIEVLEDRVDDTIVNKTGFADKFNLRLDYTVGVVPGVTSSADSGASAPSSNWSAINSALQEQLGLRLQPAKGPVEVLVVDHVERPSEN